MASATELGWGARRVWWALFLELGKGFLGGMGGGDGGVVAIVLLGRAN
jgi:hypothetical protein